MSPVFGICNTHLQPPDPDMIYRMKEVANYAKPRKVAELEVPGGYMATAVVTENPLVDAKDVIAMEGPWAIVADASLYKREELIHRIGRRGVGETWDKGQGIREKKKGDGELILEAWMKFGEECVNYLYGDFAFVIFNTDTGAVFCGRDQLGVRPFFYMLDNDSFIFGSELRYVHAALPVKPAIRQEYLLDTLVTVKSAKELSPFENIFRLKPGHCLLHSAGNIKIQQYWKPDPEKKIRFDTEAEYIDLFRGKLESAVNMRCKGAYKPGSELSGGLDSSAVTGIAAAYATSNNLLLTAFSNIFPSDTGIDFKDEQAFISHMRDYKRFTWVGVDRLSNSIPELLQHAIDIQGCYTQQHFNIFNRGLYEAAGERGVQTLLSGFGGDELVSARIAMPWNELINYRQWKVIVDELFYEGITLKNLLKPGLIAARYLKSRLRQTIYTSGVFTPELLDGRFANIPLQPQFAERNSLRKRLGDNYRRLRRDKTSWRQFDRITLDHLPQRMEYCYTAAAQYGVEYRYPLLDVDLVETCLAFPPWLKQHHGVNRYLFRQAIKGYVPEEIRLRDDKSGSTIPQMYFSLVGEKELLLELVNSCRNHAYINSIFNLLRFPEWYERLVKRDKEELNYLMPGAFYDYLMILLYYRDKDRDEGRGTRDKGRGTSEK
jgi:asparagine synthase (glutamine-hydrolysing)